MVNPQKTFSNQTPNNGWSVIRHLQYKHSSLDSEYIQLQTVPVELPNNRYSETLQVKMPNRFKPVNKRIITDTCKMASCTTIKQ